MIRVTGILEYVEAQIEDAPVSGLQAQLEGFDQKGSRLELNAVVCQKLDFNSLFQPKLNSLAI